MFSSMNRKRTRDPTDDGEALHHEKKLRCSSGHDQGDMTSNPPSLLMPSSAAMTSSDMLSSGEENSADSTISEPSSSDTDMEMDTTSDFRMAFSQSPEQASFSWPIRPSPLRTPGMAVDDRGTRIPTPSVISAIRPQPMPVQVRTTFTTHQSSNLASRSHLAVERFPSPISEDEPHTPTTENLTAAGSQLSLLTVTDMDLDMEPPEAASQMEPATVRKQRQRSGAFTSPRETPKKFTMGYREDCEKCRNKVPGHMNHFLGR